MSLSYWVQRDGRYVEIAPFGEELERVIEETDFPGEEGEYSWDMSERFEGAGEVFLRSFEEEGDHSKFRKYTTERRIVRDVSKFLQGLEKYAEAKDEKGDVFIERLRLKRSLSMLEISVCMVPLSRAHDFAYVEDGEVTEVVETE